MSSSNYAARRSGGPNVSQFLAGLNTVPPAQELAAAGPLDFDETNLEFFTNTEFFDFDQYTAPPPLEQPGFNGRVGGVKGGMSGGAQFPQFGEFQTYPPTVASTPTYAHQSPPTNGLAHATPPQLGDKRKAGGAPADLEEQSRIAAEEDKRRRNTAASARFRVKKKQREQALEKQTKEMGDKLAALEGKVKQLEMENSWLKGLLTEKNGGVAVPESKAEADGVEDVVERSSEGVKRGIGTEEEEIVEGGEE